MKHAPWETNTEMAMRWAPILTILADTEAWKIHAERADEQDYQEVAAANDGGHHTSGESFGGKRRERKIHQECFT